MPRTKIVATIGPACAEAAVLEAIIIAGVSVFRLNFSHGTPQDHRAYINAARKAARQAGREIMIFGDLPGPKIRLGQIDPAPLSLSPGDHFFLTHKAIRGTAAGASVNYPHLARDLKPTDAIALNDGAVILRVLSVDTDRVNCEVVTGGEISSRKGVNFPGIRLSARALTAADRQWIRFAVAEHVDALALSFVRERDDILKARRAVTAAGGSLPVIAKIEKHEAVEQLEAILDAADGAMAARGDLGVEVPLELVPGIQKHLVKICNRLGKPVITATQMLESMIRSARPTRAEVSDVANAILDGSDAVMLSGETAVGLFPVDAVRMMARVAEETDRMVPQVNWLHEFIGCPIDCTDEAIAHSVFRVSERVGASAILCLTISGATARRISRYRPRIPVIAFSARRETRRQLQMSWGIETLDGVGAVFPKKQSVDQTLARAVELAVDAGLIRKGQTVVVAAGVPLQVEGNTNLIRVIEA